VPLTGFHHDHLDFLNGGGAGGPAPNPSDIVASCLPGVSLVVSPAVLVVPVAKRDNAGCGLDAARHLAMAFPGAQIAKQLNYRRRNSALAFRQIVVVCPSSFANLEPYRSQSRPVCALGFQYCASCAPSEVGAEF